MFWNDENNIHYFNYKKIPEIHSLVEKEGKQKIKDIFSIKMSFIFEWHKFWYLDIIDENYSVLHSKRGILGMANKGRHSNSSQFYITFQPAPWMDCQYVAFG